jgi:hypothetical protein
MVALFGFGTTFDSWYYLAVSAIGVAIGLVVAHIIAALRWDWTIGLVGAVGAYFLFGGAIAVRQDLIGSVLPTWPTLIELWNLLIHGWKQLVTTLPPVSGTGRFLALPFVLALVASAGAYGLARAYKALAWPVLPLAGLFGLVIALGTDISHADLSYTLLPQGLLWVLLMVTWNSYRSRTRSRLATGARTFRFSRLAGGVGILLAAALAATVTAPYLPGVNSTREIIRNHVQVPIENSPYHGPLASFRKFSSESQKDRYYYDKTLLTVEGAEPGSLLRFAVLDSYDGWVWGASGSGFLKVGSRIPTTIDGVPMTGDAVNMTVTIGQTYAEQAPLNVWVPNLGYATEISFNGDNARQHDQGLVYDMRKGQGLVLDQFKSNDVFQVTSIKTPTITSADDLNQEIVPSGMILVPAERTEFLAADLALMSEGKLAPWDQLKATAVSFANGSWSDGTEGPGREQYRPGHGQGRLKTFLEGLPNCVGSDEHYAAMFALFANRIGYPARVVFGATMPVLGNEVRGQDVTVWVEIRTTDGWVAIHPSVFIPDRENFTADERPKIQDDPNEVSPVPEKKPKEPNTDELGGEASGDITPPFDPPKPGDLPAWGWVAVGTGSSLGLLFLLTTLLLIIKGVRAWSRRTRGTYVNRIAAGWADAIDRARDVGIKVTAAQTRTEQALGMAGTPLLALAASSERAMFQPAAPDREIVTAYWDEVRALKAELLGERRGLKKLWSRITPRSLWPAPKVKATRLPRPHRTPGVS